MDEFDDIENLYHDKLNEFSGEPDANVWSRLDASLDLDAGGIEKWYKNKIEQIDESPSLGIWDELSVNLDTDTVWSRLLRSLRRRDKFIWWWKFSFGSIVLLAGFSFWYFNQNSTSHAIYNKENLSSIQDELEGMNKEKDFHEVEKLITQNQEEGNGDITVNNMPLEYTSVESSINPILDKNSFGKSKWLERDDLSSAEVPRPTEVSGVVSSNGKAYKSEGGVWSLPPISYDSSIIERKVFESVELLPSIQINNSITPKLNLPIVDSLTKNKPKDGLFFRGGLTNSWLLNSDTYQSLRANSSDYTLSKLTWYGGIGYTKWMKKAAVEIDLTFSEKGHNYMVYLEGHSYEKKIALNYVVGNIRLKKEVFKNENPFTASYLSGGVYYSRLVNQNLVFNGLPYQNFGDYAKNDLGISLAYEHRVKNISIDLSVSEGIVNIYRGNEYVKFNKTYNMVISAGLRYYFKQ